MTGAQAIAVAIGQAHAAGSSTVNRRRAQTATASENTSATAAAIRGKVNTDKVAKTGPLKRTRSTTLGTAPRGI